MKIEKAREAASLLIKKESCEIYLDVISRCESKAKSISMNIKVGEANSYLDIDGETVTDVVRSIKLIYKNRLNQILTDIENL